MIVQNTQGPWTTLELRDLRKAARYRLVGSGLGSRRTPPSGDHTTQGITLERRRTLDVVADWIVQGER